MGGTVTKSLYLQIGGDVTALNTAAKAGKSVLASLGDAAVNVEAEVKKAFADFGNSIPDQAKRIERSFNDTFAQIRRNAQSVLDAPNGHAAVQVLNAGAADQAAAAAEKQAVALRQVATAASTVADRAGAAGAAERVLAVASAAVAERAEQEAAALRAQAQLLGVVDAEVRASAGGIVDAGDRVVGAHQRMGASGAILQHVVRSTTDSFAAGLPASIIFAEQISRLGEAAAFAAQEGGEAAGLFGKFGAVMAGPWGLAITVGISLAAQLVGKLIESRDTIASETEKLKTNADQARLASDAKAAFARTEAGIAEDIRLVTDELKKQNDALRSNAELANIKAKTDLKNAQSNRDAAAKKLDPAQEALRRIEADAPDRKGDTGYAARLGEARKRVADLRNEIAAADRDITAASAARLSSQRELDAEAAKRQADPLEQIKRRYENPDDGLIVTAQRQATAEEVVNGVLKRRLALLYQQQDAETKAEQKRQAAENRTPKAPPLGHQIETEQAASVLASAQHFAGLNEHSASGRAGLQDLFSQAGIHIDPAMTAWCAAFVNAVLATNGIKGTGSLSARSFLNYGEKTDRPDKGDIVVLKRGTGDQGHVGFFAGTDGKGRVLVTGGNQGDQVSTEAFARSSVLGFRRAPSASEADKAAAAARNRAATDDRGFTNADRQIDDAIARAKQQLSTSIDEDYAIQLARTAADLEAKNRAIDDEVTAGKLTQAQANELQIKNAQLAELEELAATEKRRVALANAAFQVDSDASAGRLALLQLDAALATTRRGRLAVERQILDEEQKRQRDVARHAVDIAPAGSDERERAQAELARLPGLQERQDRQFDHDHQDALGSLRQQLTSNVGDMNDALKGVEVDGLRGLEDGLVGLVDGTETVAGAFKKMASAIIADLARIAIEKAILSFIGFKDGGLVGSVTPEKHAAGGFISGKGTGTSDDILSWLSNGEFVVRAAPTRKHLPLLKAINEDRLPGFATGGLVGGLPSIPTTYPSLPRPDQVRSNTHVTVRTITTVEPNEMFDVRSRSIAQQTVGAAAQPIMAGATTQTMRKLRRPALPGGYA